MTGNEINIPTKFLHFSQLPHSIESLLYLTVIQLVPVKLFEIVKIFESLYKNSLKGIK